MPTPAARATVAAAATIVALVAAPRRAAADAPRPLAGSVGLVQKETAVRNACVGSFRTIKKVKRGDDPAFVAAMTYPRAKPLDIDPANQVRARASLKRFETWFKGLEKQFTTARKVQETVGFAPGATPQAKVEAAARISILIDQAAMLLEAVEMPAHIRKDAEGRDVFCDTMLERAEPLRKHAAEARGACARAIAESSLAPGWWTEVCVTSPPATAP